MSTERMTPVRSSKLQAVADDTGSRTRFVQSRSAATYEYRDVEPEKHEALMSARSVGRYFTKQIRDQYQTVKLDSDAAVLTRMRELDGFRAEIAARQRAAQERQRAFEENFRTMIGRGSRPVVVLGVAACASGLELFLEPANTHERGAQLDGLALQHSPQSTGLVV
jgi:hypothetical protein